MYGYKGPNVLLCVLLFHMVVNFTLSLIYKLNSNVYMGKKIADIEFHTVYGFKHILHGCTITYTEIKSNKDL